MANFNTGLADGRGALHTEPVGNSAGLGSFHTVNAQDRKPNHTPQIIGAVAVALMVGAAAVGIYAYWGPSKPKPVVADNHLPSPPPVPVASLPLPQTAPQPAATTPPAAAQPANLAASQ